MSCLKIIIFSSAIFLGSENILAQETVTEEQVVGAVVGGVIGSQIGSGSGRDAATIAGALIGYNWASNKIHGQREFVRHCRRVVPLEYKRNDGARKAWIEGCVNSLEEKQLELEKEAYEDGLRRK